MVEYTFGGFTGEMALKGPFEPERVADQDTRRAVPATRVRLSDHGTVLEDLKRRIGAADLPDPVFAVLGAVDLAARVPGAAGKYYGELVERGHARLVEVGTQRAVRKRVSTRMENRASRMAVRYKQRQRRVQRERSA